MRGDLALQSRIALRPGGITGLVAAVAGLTAVASVYLPWYVVVAEVSMLGATRSRTLVALPGWQSQPWTWVVAALGLLCAGIGLAIAADRPPRRPAAALIVAAVALACIVSVSVLITPSRARDAAGPDLTELEWLAGRLPDDVSIVLSVRPSGGIWVALAAAGLILAAALLNRRV